MEQGRDALDKYHDLYMSTLTNDVIPFWVKNCPDREYGAYFTCLDRDGSVYDTEKYMWMQWRIVWMLCELHTKIGPNDEWLKLAESGYRFLTKHGKDEKGRYYFSLARDGRPTLAPFSVFSECFAMMGAAAYYRATGDQGAKAEALSAFDKYCQRENNPKGEFSKELPGRDPMRGLGFYMIKSNLYTVLQECLGDNSHEADLLKTINIVLDDFWNPEYKVAFENIRMDGTFDLDSMAGRHLNPGHVIEAMWFIMNAAVKMGRQDIIKKAADITLAELEFGWDKECGGIYYFMDVLGKPHMELQWNMKLWWVHNEALIAALMAYKLTGRPEFAEWFTKLHDWTWSHFPDTEYGEWYGYLDRHGDPTHYLKGGKWKGFFHLPRMLLVCGEWMR
jgi:N-acylglucosamine 2-epimerase